ncbi:MULTISPECIES: O-antigen ligase [unclassified Lentimicrobium]|uniref:O-antigen ligase family protein n=1 Tax=unclassified Lentimicrobium TaxID=2677434 RepID=UPI001557EFB3|nr:MULTISPECIES: O-antigen ligase family protein [unclassified Lentimicrobium]NPD44598.1 O-antigen ligase family protein [Lentimicrobium sp. S6]NPD83310.1 O-antigen ligase family protein [Lentimicrobium sp. L6]
MKDLQRITIYKNLIIFLILGFLLLSISPFWHLLPSVAILSFLTILSYNGAKQSLVNLNKNKWHVLLFSSLFFSYLLGMAYTTNKNDGWLDVMLKSSFLLFPLTYGIFPNDLFKGKDLRKILNSYVFILFGSTLFCFVNAILSYQSHSDPSVFYYTKFVFFQHPSYYGLYVNMGVLIILNQWIRDKDSMGQKSRILQLALLPWFLIILFLVQSKAAILTAGFLAILAVFDVVVFRKNIKKGISIFLSFVLIYLVAIVIIPKSSDRFDSATQTIEQRGEVDNTKESTAARLSLWKIAFKTIIKQPLLGVGTGDVETVYNEELKKEGFLKDGEMTYNSHSQYLQTAIALGIFGLLVLLANVIFPFVIGFKERNLLYMGLAVTVAFNILVESMLERQAGVMFFTFFNSFIFFVLMRTKER